MYGRAECGGTQAAGALDAERARARRRAAAGGLYVAASALCFGAMPVFARAARAGGADTQTLLLLRFSIAAAVMWALFLARGTRLPGRAGIGMLVGMGGIGYAGQSFAYFHALTLASAGLVSLLLYLYPALVAVLSAVVLRHRLGRAQVAAVAIALAGSALTIGRAGSGQAAGVLFGVLAASIYAVYILVGSRLPADVTATASTAIVTSSAAAVYGAIALARGVSLPVTAGGWAGVAGIAIVGTVLAVGFFLAGLERIGPVRASVYSTLEPAFTILLGAVLLGEAAAPVQLAGGALILAAVVLLARADALAATA